MIPCMNVDQKTRTWYNPSIVYQKEQLIGEFIHLSSEFKKKPGAAIRT
jgi:hypothetical protein